MEIILLTGIYPASMDAEVFLMTTACFFFFLVIFFSIRQLVSERQKRSVDHPIEEADGQHNRQIEEISRELCTPLTLIDGVEEQIRSYAGGAGDPELERYADVLRKNVKEANRLIGEMRSLREESLEAAPKEARETSVPEPMDTYNIKEEGRIGAPEDRPLVLVVDKRKDMSWLVSEILSPEYRVEGASDRDEALEFMARYTPVLIISDWIEAGPDGQDLLSQIKANKYTRHIPIVIVSALASSVEQAEALDRGADAYLPRPFPSRLLRSVVNRLITSRSELKRYFYSPESAYRSADGLLLHQEDKEFLDTVTSIVKEHIGQEGLGPELIAEAMHINTRILYRRFKRISSMTPSDFIKDYRLSHAAQLLVNTNLSVQEIVYQVGISNKSYFYREFARKYNRTPRAYRLQES